MWPAGCRLSITALNMYRAVEVGLPGSCLKTSLLRLEQWYRDRPCIDGQLIGDLRLKLVACVCLAQCHKRVTTRGVEQD
ncbi:hypothetical protein TNCV_1134981 [Trichonephila clavipes]|nr:hypothetical protein TNCV_1134981 [Trichonephila clavipes]